MIIKAFLAWLPIVPLATFNGVIRDKGYGNHLSELAVHQISILQQSCSEFTLQLSYQP